MPQSKSTYFRKLMYQRTLKNFHKTSSCCIVCINSPQTEHTVCVLCSKKMAFLTSRSNLFTVLIHLYCTVVSSWTWRCSGQPSSPHFSLSSCHSPFNPIYWFIQKSLSSSLRGKKNLWVICVNDARHASHYNFSWFHCQAPGVKVINRWLKLHFFTYPNILLISAEVSTLNRLLKCFYSSLGT